MKDDDGLVSAPFRYKEQLRLLFEQIDAERKGRVCTNDLKEVLDEYRHRQRRYPRSVFEVFLLRCARKPDDYLTLPELVKCMEDLDHRLTVALSHLSRTKSGRVMAVDVVDSLDQLGVNLTFEEAESLLGRADHSWILRLLDEFTLFQPVGDMPVVFGYQRRDTCIDAASDAAIGVPEDSFPLGAGPSKQLRQLIAGGIAGAVSRSCTAPIDRLKLMRQVHGYKHKGSSFIHAYRYMLHEGGLSSLWRGNAISVLKIAPETALKYGSYEHYKRFLTSSGGRLSELLDGRPVLTKFLAGSLAGSTAQTVIYPLEVLKTRMCLRKTGQYTSAWDCARSIYKELGLRAFYRGYFVNLLGIVPYAGTELAMYERCKAAYTMRFMSGENTNPSFDGGYKITPPVYVIPVLAAFSSACGIMVTYPASLIRAKLQAAYWSRSTQKKITAVDLVRTIWRMDGLVGLYRGMLTNLTKVLPAVGISLCVYETLRKEFRLGPLGSG
ncbi:unnamed protein product [Calicophoron daubneyi]|uniref:Uncharacterized protein n=1 Tax=Calicophoron daubneyi TaxID=300641 RepID=A0AAV2TVJ4_CALDB